MLALADRLVSWGDEGGIRFWSLEGTPLPGGAADAHSGWVGGVLALGDRLVKVFSWYDNEWGFSCRLRDVIKLVLR